MWMGWNTVNIFDNHLAKPEMNRSQHPLSADISKVIYSKVSVMPDLIGQTFS